MLAKTYAIAHIIASRGVNDDEAPKWDYDPIGGDLQEETGQEAADTWEDCFGVERIPLSTPLFGAGAQFYHESTNSMSPVSAGFAPHDPHIPELDHMASQAQERQQFQIPRGPMQSSQEDRLTPETSALNYFPLGQHDPRLYLSSPIPYTSVGESLSPVSTPFAWTAPTFPPNTGTQSSLLSHVTSAGTSGSLDSSGVCPDCGYKVSTAKEARVRNNSVRRHIRERHGQSVICPQCGQNFTRPSNMERHITEVHG